MRCVKKKNEEEEEEDEAEEEEEIAVEEREAKTKRATAITGDERRKNDSCINTARPRHIYIYVSPLDVELSSCFDDGRLSRETTSKAFASSSSSSSSPVLFLFLSFPLSFSFPRYWALSCY